MKVLWLIPLLLISSCAKQLPEGTIESWNQWDCVVEDLSVGVTTGGNMAIVPYCKISKCFQHTIIYGKVRKDNLYSKKITKDEDCL